jgi:murein DD-endopeptidase MepM/ murein hydrolase activator NlpD
MGTVTSPYGWRDDKPHQGVDLEVHLHDSILCSFDGKVRLARNYDGYGKVVIVRHYNGLETLYAHLNKIKVKDGDVVKVGHFIGTGGMTGNASVPIYILKSDLKEFLLILLILSLFRIEP